MALVAPDVATVLTWMFHVAAFLAGVGSLGWVVTQGRKLHREERQRKELERATLELVDGLAESSRGIMSSTYLPVPQEMREAALLAERWGAVEVRWDKGGMLVRLRNWSEARQP
jgi:hypothetical protein